MSSSEDWLQDPIMRIGRGSYKYHKLKRSTDEQNDTWQGFHFSTRLKLDASDYFCRQVLGAASRPSDLGLPLLAYRQLKWYLDAFFFELMSAYDTLLQEVNVVYNLGLDIDKVSWRTMKDKLDKSKLTRELGGYMEKERGKEWFKKVHQYRNIAAHRSYLWTGEMKGGWGDKPWGYDVHEVSIYRLDDTGTVQMERISVCTELLTIVVGHIQQVWRKMAQRFTKRPTK